MNLVELQNVQELQEPDINAQQARELAAARLQQQQQDDMAQLTAQQAQDEAVLERRKRRQQAQSARAQVEYHEYLKHLALARLHKKEKSILGESSPGAPSRPPPENTPAQPWDPNQPHNPDKSVASDPAGYDDLNKVTPSPPRPGEEYNDYVNEHNRMATAATQRAANHAEVYGRAPDPSPPEPGMPGARTAEHEESDSRSASGPAPPPVPGAQSETEANNETPSDPDGVPPPDPAAAAAWAASQSTANNGGRNDIESNPTPTSDFVKKYFVDEPSQEIVTSIEPRYPQAPADPHNAELYQNATVIAHDGGQRNPDDEIPPPPPPLVDQASSVSKGPASIYTTTIQPNRKEPVVVERSDPGEPGEEYLHAPAQPDQPEAAPTIPNAEEAKIRAEAEQWYQDNVDSLSKNPATKKMTPTQFAESKQKSLVVFREWKASRVKERETKYLADAGVAARTHQERIKKKRIVEAMNAKTASERTAKTKITAVERAAKKIEKANMLERTAKERATKPTEAEQAKADEAEEKETKKQMEKLEEERELELTAAHKAEEEREKKEADERKAKGKTADELLAKNGPRESLGEILAQDAYLASINTKGQKSAKVLKQIATNLQVRVEENSVHQFSLET